MKLKFDWSKDLNNFFVAICGMVSNVVSVIRYFSKMNFSNTSYHDKNGSNYLNSALQHDSSKNKIGILPVKSREYYLKTFSEFL